MDSLLEVECEIRESVLDRTSLPSQPQFVGVQVGSAIARNDDPAKEGTLGPFLVEKGSSFIHALTCHHVMCDKPLTILTTDDDILVISPGDGTLSLHQKILTVSGEILEQIGRDGRGCQPLDVTVLHPTI